MEILVILSACNRLLRKRDLSFAVFLVKAFCHTGAWDRRIRRGLTVTFCFILSPFLPVSLACVYMSKPSCIMINCMASEGNRGFLLLRVMHYISGLIGIFLNVLIDLDLCAQISWKDGGDKFPKQTKISDIGCTVLCRFKIILLPHYYISSHTVEIPTDNRNHSTGWGWGVSSCKLIDTTGHLFIHSQTSLHWTWPLPSTCLITNLIYPCG